VWETPWMQNDRQLRQGILPLPCALFRREKEQTEKLGEEEKSLWQDTWEDLFLRLSTGE
jgi:hypothetical protein